MPRRVIPGIGVSKGVGVGKCLIIRTPIKRQERGKKDSGVRTFSAPEEEIELFESAVGHVKRELEEIRDKVKEDARRDAAEIFDAQLLMLGDPLLVDEVETRIRTKLLTAEQAVNQSIEHLNEIFSSLSSGYMRERGEDIRDIGSRIVDALRGRHEELEFSAENIAGKDVKIVLASRSLAAATVAHFGEKLLAGIVAETGSKTSHLAIVARSLRIPAVLGAENVVSELNEGDRVIVDGDKGQIIVNPNDREMEEAEEETRIEASEASSSWEPTETIDGHKVKVFANVADLESVKEASMSGAEGIGLFRTEFLYYDRRSSPSEDELFEVMKQSVSLMCGRTIIVRTLDIGGDKKPSYIEFPEEKNPALGLRGIRFSLRNPSILETQLAAILRASAEGSVWIMFPMVSTIKDLRHAEQILEEVKKGLKKRKISFKGDTKIGIMVETPSAALTSDKLAEEADFFSIGTNDLVQYTLAADRENASVSAIADPLEPSVLKLIQQTISNAHGKSRHVGMCGEMAADLDAVPILLGLGLDEFSVNPSSVRAVRNAIQSLRYSETQEAALESLKLETATQIREYSKGKFRQRQP